MSRQTRYPGESACTHGTRRGQTPQSNGQQSAALPYPESRSAENGVKTPGFAPQNNVEGRATATALQLHRFLEALAPCGGYACNPGAVPKSANFPLSRPTLEFEVALPARPTRSSLPE